MKDLNIYKTKKTLPSPNMLFLIQHTHALSCVLNLTE